eukprot:CAMPEP_0118946348 /NCGR_PEP_ID=MMETSP1169-20130426/44062_1 /TAXON_ID=36882 /ORGANISM="Pyramimonas obovata, Strain CCMP722" /LENGTH=372 /DNA_ID=CAMNT_0006892295 /DNA_START=227 /DNA_END=1341 /DNA_ORIENTATION=-
MRMSPAPKMSNARNTSKQGGILESTAMARGSSTKSHPSGSVFTPRRSPRFAFANTPQGGSHLSVDQSVQSLGARKSTMPFQQGLRSEGSEGSQKPGTRRRASVVRRSSESDAVKQAPTWDRITETMTSLSTVPFLFLLMPQVYKNTLQLMAGNSAALAIISWAGYTSGMLGNLLLFSYFASKGERSAAFVQGIGVLSTATLLVQVFIAGYFPAQFFWPVAAIVSAGTAFGVFTLLDRLDDRVWKAWQAVLGLIGLATLPQTLWMTFVPSATSALPALTGAVLGGSYVALEEFGFLPARLLGLRSIVSAWTATVLFMLMPLPQLANNLSNPASVHGLSVLSVLLGMCGNALMIPRALYTRDVVWLAGCTWGAT